ETGLPQHDELFTTMTKAEERTLKTQYGFDPAKKLIVYAPTFRFRSGYAFRYLIDFNYLKQKLGDEYEIAIKLHHYNHTHLPSIDFKDLTTFDKKREASFVHLFGEVIDNERY